MIVALVAAVRSADEQSIRLTFRDGATSTHRVEAANETFGPPRISPDGLLVGWTDLRRDGASYGYPIGVRLYRGGHRFDAACTAGMPWSWQFLSDSRIALRCAFPHGSQASSLHVVDLTRAPRR